MQIEKDIEKGMLFIIRGIDKKINNKLRYIYKWAFHVKLFVRGIYGKIFL